MATQTQTGNTAKVTSLKDIAGSLSSAKKMSAVIVQLEAARRLARDEHDAAEVISETLRQKVRDASRWPALRGWDKIPESRRQRKLAMEAAADYADAADVWDSLVVREQRIMEDLNSARKGREKFAADQ
jgi:hypothetical protein